MKILSITAFTLFWLITCSYPVGLQHGRFRSQSTQGNPWTGSATIIEERFNITVYPDYLDVEHDWVFKVSGTEPDTFKDALEIVGNFSLEDKSVLVSMITWYKDMVLKAKLKKNDVARAEYEEVVERDSDAPPPPRDPVLIELVGDDLYDISIFPVTFGKTRHVRFRYLVPAFMVNGENKIGYPHAFINDARVNIRQAPGVNQYRIETRSGTKEFDNTSYAALSSADYSFTPSNRDKRIIHIVPVLPGEIQGSRLYIGDFATEEFSGQVAHFTAMTTKEILEHLNMPQDYVILWRWNHTKYMAQYAAQIVDQCILLQEFLNSLEAANKRAALIIDKQGGERITFSLGARGSREYDNLMNYLVALQAEMAMVQPPVSRGGGGSGYYPDVHRAFQEFEDALRAAMDMFDNQNQSLKHLLILCAGPSVVHRYVSDQNVNWDNSINVALMTSFFKGSGKYSNSLGSDSYWPGVDLGAFINRNRTNLKVCAHISNG
jgi:hypothetical protein